MVYTWSFAAATPSFRCKLSDNDVTYSGQLLTSYNRSQPDETYCKAHMKISVKECQRCYMKTTSNDGSAQIQPCNDYVFDRKYHQYTLVEEVCIMLNLKNYSSKIVISYSGQWSVIGLFFVQQYRIYSSLVTWLDRSSSESWLISMFSFYQIGIDMA